MDVVCLNGEFRTLEQATLSATDAGFLLGEGVFETIRAEQGHLLFFAEHIARLARGLRVLEIGHAADAEALRALCEQVLDANDFEEARVRLTVTRGPVRGLPIVATEGEPTVMITASPLDPAQERQRSTGWRMVPAPFPKNHRSPLASIKCTSYAEPLLARRQARALGFDEALMLNIDGAVAEASMANVFAVAGGTLVTPPVADGALPGIARAQVMQVAARHEVPVVERSMRLEDLLSAEEVFVTNAIVLMMPIVLVGERTIGNGRPGALTQMLARHLRHEIERLVADTIA